MKAMFLSDVLVARKYLSQQLVISILVGAFIAVMMGNLYATAPTIGVMMPFSLAVTILALDERAGWQQFRLALPITRADVVIGRYASFALLCLAGIAIGLLATLILIAAAQAAPTVPQLAVLMENFSWQALLIASVASVAILLLMLAIVMPAFVRFGMTKAVRLIPLIVIVFVLIAFQAVDGNIAAELVKNVEGLLQTPGGDAALIAGVLALAAALYAASAALSVKLYAKREL